MKPIRKLTKTEQAVFEKLLDGYSYDELMSYFNVERTTIRKHVSNILAKYNKPSSLKLVADWYRDQLDLL